MTKEKSNCCGAEIKSGTKFNVEYAVDDDVHWCKECDLACFPISPDCMSCKEILEFIDSCDSENLYLVDASYCKLDVAPKNPTKQLVEKLQIVLSSVREHFKNG